MGITPDRFPGPAIEEEMRYEDRGPGGDDDGDPSFEGALRRVTHALRFFVGSTVRQILQVKNPPAGFDEIDLDGVQDGDALTYNAATHSVKPAPVVGGSLLGKAIFTVAGGMVYSNDGDIVLKVNA